MWQPGSCRDFSVNWENRVATSASWPNFAIHVTTSTTMICSQGTLSTSPDWLPGGGLQRLGKVVHDHGLFAIGARGHHPDASTRFSFQEIHIVASCLWQLVKLIYSVSRGPPSWQLFVNACDLLKAAILLGNLVDCLTIDFVSDTN